MYTIQFRLQALLIAMCLLSNPALLGQSTPQLTTNASTTSAALSLPGERLVPAALGVRSDRFGYSWSIEENGALGRVGSSMVNSGLNLTINQQKFATFQPRMTRDGQEFVIYGKPLSGLAGIQIMRRVKLVEDIGAIRYLETFFNGSANHVTLNIELATSLSGSFENSVTNRSRIDPVLLEAGETGLLVTPGSAQSNRSFLFVLCGPDATDKPSISAKTRYGLKFQYQLTLAPGETKCIAHIVTQTVSPQEFDRQTLSRLFKPYSIAKLQHTIPDQFQTLVANRSSDPSRSDSLASGIQGLQTLGVERPDTDDLLVFGDQTRLLGSITIDDFALHTYFGKTLVQGNQIIAISGTNRGVRESVRVFLQDGQIISGKANPETTLVFKMKGGGQMRLNFDKLDRLLVALSKDSYNPPADQIENQTMVSSWYGDFLKLTAADDLLFFGLTPWGELSFNLSDLTSITPAPDGQPGCQISLRSGTQCTAFLTSRELILKSKTMGKLTIPFDAIHSLAPSSPNQTPAPLETKFKLLGDQSVFGKLSNDPLQIVSNSQQINVQPREIRRVSRHNSGNPQNPTFLIEMWDGSRIEGLLRTSQIQANIQNTTWNIPSSDLLSIEAAGPDLDAEAQTKLAGLVDLLGDDSWAIREQATAELAKFGYLAIPILRGELNQNPDPEVRRRLDRILDQMKPN